MPYKHISKHLKKTELACRLHFHQISFGTKRRRRALSITSVGSIDKSPHPPARQQHGHSIPKRRLPSFSPAPIEPHNRRRSIDTSPESPPNTRSTPIHPKPRGMSYRESLSTNALHLITANLQSPAIKKQAIDTARLTHIYHAHRVHFWALVARDYGHDASPIALEEAWRKLPEGSSHATFPPTPSESPPSAEEEKPSALDSPSSASTDSDGYSGFSPVNARKADASGLPSGVERGSFAIASLLTEDKDITVTLTWDGECKEAGED